MQPRWCAMLLAISASAEEIIAAGNAGDARAIAATRSFSKYLAQGCCSLIQLLDPEALILSGGVAQNNPMLLQALGEKLAVIVPAWKERELMIVGSPLGYYGGVLGAAAVAMERLFC
jgi:predicted NBD/HSP70 family sugar kinase